MKHRSPKVASLARKNLENLATWYLDGNFQGFNSKQLSPLTRLKMVFA
jgi:hypothetical protein